MFVLNKTTLSKHKGQDTSKTAIISNENTQNLIGFMIQQQNKFVPIGRNSVPSTMTLNGAWRLSLTNKRDD